jgi:hypothetical protein
LFEHASAMSARYGSHALALGGRPARATGTESVDTSWEIAGFGFDSLGTTAASHRHAGGFQVAGDPLAANARRLLDARQRPARRPSARISCCVWSSKTLLMPATEPAFRARVKVSAGSVNCCLTCRSVLAVHEVFCWKNRLDGHRQKVLCHDPRRTLTLAD